MTAPLMATQRMLVGSVSRHERGVCFTGRSSWLTVLAQQSDCRRYGIQRGKGKEKKWHTGPWLTCVWAIARSQGSFFWSTRDTDSSLQARYPGNISSTLAGSAFEGIVFAFGRPPSSGHIVGLLWYCGQKLLPTILSGRSPKGDEKQGGFPPRGRPRLVVVVRVKADAGTSACGCGTRVGSGRRYGPGGIDAVLLMLLIVIVAKRLRHGHPPLLLLILIMHAAVPTAARPNKA